MSTHRLRTRPPTGRVPWPLVLVEGGEKAGKSWACAELSASPRVGQTYWIDLGEGTGDEYGAIPAARYLMIDHDGSWADIIGQVEAVRDEARRAADANEPPVVLVIDTVTAVWDLLKDWVTTRAKRYEVNRKALDHNPDAEIVIPMNLWNDANTRWRRLMTILMTFPGIAVVTARGKDVAALDDNGKPIKNAPREYRVEGQKNLAYDCTAWVRMSRDHAPTIIGARSVHAGVRPGVDEPTRVRNFTLEWLIFDHLRCDPTSAHVRNLIEGHRIARSRSATGARPGPHRRPAASRLHGGPAPAVPGRGRAQRTGRRGGTRRAADPAWQGTHRRGDEEPRQRSPAAAHVRPVRPGLHRRP